jgi:uncharacterized protein
MHNNYNNLSVAEHYIVKNNRDYIYLDVNSLEVFLLDETDHQIISAVKNNNKEDSLTNLVKKYGETVIDKHIDELQKNGVFSKGNDNQTEKIKNHKNQTNFLEAINSINVQISEDCNLACKYCFVKENQYRNKSALMQSGQGVKVIDFLIKSSGKIEDLYISFFGGEPLMNFNVIEKMIVYALEQGNKNNKSFHFSLTTNGTLFSDEVIDFIDKYNIWVVVSIDGNMLSQDKNRSFIGGEGSYIIIEKNIKKMQVQNIGFSARVTVSSLTANRIAENYEHLISLGFKKIHIENALSPQGEVFINKKEEIEEIKKQYLLISKKIRKTIQTGQPYNFESFPFPLGKITSKKTGNYSCNAGNGYVSVDVNGDIFLCHRLVGESNFHIGNVNENKYELHWLETIKHKLNVDTRKTCSTCWARYICGGGCYEINYNFNNDISLSPGIYCQLMKHNIKLALGIYVEAAEWTLCEK